MWRECKAGSHTKPKIQIANYMHVIQIANYMHVNDRYMWPKTNMTVTFLSGVSVIFSYYITIVYMTYWYRILLRRVTKNKKVIRVEVICEVNTKMLYKYVLTANIFT